MKREKISIKWKVFLYFLAFTSLLLLILWLLQTVYLDVFYKNIKRRELQYAMDHLIEAVDMENLGETISNIATSYDINVTVIGEEREVLFATEAIFTDHQGKLNQGLFYEWYQLAKEHNGEYRVDYQSEEPQIWNKREFQQWDNLMEELPERKEFPNLPEGKGLEREGFREQMGIFSKHIQEAVTWFKIIDNQQGEERVLILSAVITPVDATVHTLQIQFAYISAILVLLSLAMAWILSRNISRSIIRVNHAAKELAKANYDVTFEAKDYREIAELSDTLNYATEELAKTETFQRELLANISHDLRTPLTMIIAYAEIMRDLPGENTPENIQIVIDESKRLTALVNDMLDVSKLQAGVLILDQKEYDLTESIRSVLNRFSKLTEQDGYTIQFEYTEHVLVEADEYKIDQVIYNLINNAINYTGSDRMVWVRQIQVGGIVRIEVIDSGMGIAKTELPYVWERYYKVDKTHKRAVMGTGLGLSIVKNILKLHEANYGVNSEVGQGSVFWFELRVQKVMEKLEKI